ncbi:hypothetical protein DL89DRAFT_284182 [Linderina pennispora]|uniref:F-box domain-containing protein n=1 Tax=Linderina pennispora TaxID=61395 RepID=A0A1Y1W812_9FUNG|nr:uncharacterized protein DL89DRAFT_284182 [Linderina pennispora]ORX69671.1 hypothetical protein DL89DRAFT_284182 [Linderina pennispora]
MHHTRHISLNSVGRDILPLIFTIVTEHSPSRNRGLSQHRQLTILATTCILWKEILIPRLVNALIIEYAGNGHWMSNADQILSAGCPELTTKVLLTGCIDQKGISTFLTMLGIFGIDSVVWSGVRVLEFENGNSLVIPVEYEDSHSDICDYLCQQFPNLEVLNYEKWYSLPGLFAAELICALPHISIHNRGKICIYGFTLSHALTNYPENITSLDLNAKSVRDLDITLQLRSSQFRRILFYNITDQIPWGLFKSKYSDVIEFTNLEWFRLNCIGRTNHPTSAANNRLTLRFPKLQRLDTDNSFNFFTDFYSLFAEIPLIALKIWEQARHFQRIDPQIVQAADTLDITIQGQLRSIDQLHTEQGSVDTFLVFFLSAATLQPPNLRRLVLKAEFIHYSFVERLLVQIPSLRVARFECSNGMEEIRTAGDEFEPVDPENLPSRIGTLPNLEEFRLYNFGQWVAADCEWACQFILCSPSLLRIGVPDSAQSAIFRFCQTRRIFIDIQVRSSYNPFLNGLLVDSLI